MALECSGSIWFPDQHASHDRGTRQGCFGRWSALRWLRDSRTRRRPILLAASALWVVTCPSRGRPRSQAAHPKTPTAFPSELRAVDDLRLTRPVATEAGLTCVGELLVAVTAATGVDLGVKARNNGCTDEPLLVALQGVPLVNAMNGLRSLLSQKGGEWVWLREGTKPNYRYRLTRSVSAAALPARLRERREQIFLSDLRDRLNSARAGRPVGTDSRAITSVREGIETFEAELSPQEKRAVLAGSEVTKRVSGFSSVGKSFVTKRFQAAGNRAPADIKMESPDGPSWVTFSLDRSPPYDSPALLIVLEGIGGYGYTSRLAVNAELDKDSRERWLLAGDEATSPREESRIPGPEPPRGWSRNLNTRMASWEHASARKRLLLLARNTGLQIIARLPSRQEPDPGPSAGSSLGGVLSRLEAAGIQHKWRDGLLLLGYKGWWAEDPRVFRPSWDVVRRLEKSTQASNGLLTFLDLSDACGYTSSRSREFLDLRFPGVGLTSQFPNLFEVRRARNDVWRALSQPSGAPLSQGLQFLGEEERSQLGGALKRRGAQALRVIEKTVKDASGAESRVFELQVLGEGGRGLGGVLAAFQPLSSNH